MDLLNKDVRLQLINEITGSENKDRKYRSFQQAQIYNSKIYDYVYEYLEQHNSPESLKQIPVVSSINISRAIVNKEASLYKCEPERAFIGVTEEQAKALKDIYHRINVDNKMLNVNKAFKTHDQAFIQSLVLNGEIKVRCFRPHQIDVIPNEIDPEIADAYIISSYDQDWNMSENSGNKLVENGRSKLSYDQIDQAIGDGDDWRANSRFVFWTKELNFVCDGYGNIVSDLADVENPIKHLSFIDIANEKEFTFFVDGGDDLADITIQYNATMSDVAHIVRMQGWSQAILKAPSTLMPENIQIGPTHLLKLPTDNTTDGQVTFEFANPNPNLQGTHEFTDKLLSNFLTTRGHDPKLVNGKGEAVSYSSGVERLLSMIEQFEASQSDMAKFRKAETELFKQIVKWINLYSGTDFLDRFYWIGKIPETATVEIKFHEPSNIMSENEKLDLVIKEIQNNLTTPKKALMKYYDLDEEGADELLEQINQANMSNYEQVSNKLNESKSKQEAMEDEEGESDEEESES
jgi:hypothetical protein